MPKPTRRKSRRLKPLSELEANLRTVASWTKGRDERLHEPYQPVYRVGSCRGRNARHGERGVEKLGNVRRRDGQSYADGPDRRRRRGATDCCQTDAARARRCTVTRKYCAAESPRESKEVNGEASKHQLRAESGRRCHSGNRRSGGGRRHQEIL